VDVIQNNVLNTLHTIKHFYMENDPDSNVKYYRNLELLAKERGREREGEGEREREKESVKGKGREGE